VTISRFLDLVVLDRCGRKPEVLTMKMIMMIMMMAEGVDEVWKVVRLRLLIKLMLLDLL
jgi:hypothetical protein